MSPFTYFFFWGFMFHCLKHVSLSSRFNLYFYFYVFATFVMFPNFVEVAFCKRCPMHPRNTPLLVTELCALRVPPMWASWSPLWWLCDHWGWCIRCGWPLFGWLPVVLCVETAGSCPLVGCVLRQLALEPCRVLGLVIACWWVALKPDMVTVSSGVSQVDASPTDEWS